MRRGLALIALLLIFAIQSVQAVGEYTVDLVTEDNTVIGTVDFVLDSDTVSADYTVTVDGWCLDGTSLYVDEDAADGLSADQFPYQHPALACTSSDSYNVPLPFGHVYLVAYADASFNPNPPQAIADSGLMTVNRATDTYFDASLDIEGLVENYPAYCVDLEHFINSGQDYAVDVFESGESLIDRPENLDKILYVINQDYSSLGASGFDIQTAIWLLIDDAIPAVISSAAQTIFNDAMANGAGFSPACGQLTGVFMDPGPNIQNIMVLIPAPCITTIQAAAWASLEIFNYDADDDGFLDDEDACPWQGNEGGLGVDETGCPYYDADWDGFFDRDDACPWRADEYGFGIDETGCPIEESFSTEEPHVTEEPNSTEQPYVTQEPYVTEEADSFTDHDGDGYVGDLDACPWRGNEGGLGVDDSGCPYYDADWDGVYDRDDECPYRGNEYGLGVDDSGCPIEGAWGTEESWVTEEPYVTQEPIANER